MEKKNQGPVIFLSLSGQAREAVLELEVDQLNVDDGVKTLLNKFDNCI